MEIFSADDRKLICIKSSVERNLNIIPSILSAHAFGCDTVPSMFGIGKKKVVAAIKKQPLLQFSNENASEEEYIKEAKMFVASCYGLFAISSSVNRSKLWKKRTEAAKLTSKPVQLKGLPPTDPVLELNIYRTRHQRMIWGSSLKTDPPPSDSRRKGWDEDKETKTLIPRMFPKGIKKAPDAVLKSTKCNCTTSQCKTNTCSCVKAQLSCSEFCGCKENGCLHKEKIVDDDEQNDEEDDYAIIEDL